MFNLFNLLVVEYASYNLTTVLCTNIQPCSAGMSELFLSACTAAEW